MCLEELDAIDAHDLMNLENSKWQCICLLVVHSRFSPCLCDASSCKTNWDILKPYYRRVVDFHTYIGTNEHAYWYMVNCEHVKEGLSKTCTFPSMNGMANMVHSQTYPPHVRGLMATHNMNLKEEGGKQYEARDDQVEAIDLDFGRPQYNPFGFRFLIYVLKTMPFSHVTMSYSTSIYSTNVIENSPNTTNIFCVIII